MKIVDVDLFQDGVQRNITMLDRLSSEVEAIEHAVNGLVQMEEQLKGAGVVPYVPFTRNVIYPSFIFSVVYQAVQTFASADGGSTSFTRTCFNWSHSRTIPKGGFRTGT